MPSFLVVKLEVTIPHSSSTSAVSELRNKKWLNPNLTCARGIWGR